MNSKKILLLALAMLIFMGGWALPSKTFKTVKADEVTVEQMASLTLTKANITLEVNETLDPQSLVVSGIYDNVEYPIVDTSEVGSVKLIYQAQKDRSIIKVAKTINVVDTIAPIWTNTADSLKVDYDDSYDLTQYFSATDSVDGDLVVEFSHTVDTQVEGNHVVTATATDKSGNQITHDITIEVGPKPIPQPVVGSQVSYSANTYGAGWCTWWVADQRAAAGNPIPNTWGNAITWLPRAQAQGFATGYTPAVGAIAYFPGANHVAYVEAVHSNGTITISEMGWGYVAWGFNRRVISASSAAYIY